MTQKKKRPSPTWPDAYVVSGKLSINHIDPQMYERYVRVQMEWHKEMQELLAKIKEQEGVDE